jgi:hypothetical protein
LTKDVAVAVVAVVVEVDEKREEFPGPKGDAQGETEGDE